MTDYTRDDLIKVQFDFLQTGSLTVTVEVEPKDGETPEETIERARQELGDHYEWPVVLCAQCSGSGYATAHKSAGGDGAYSLDLDENYGDETGAEILTDDEEDD